MSENKSLCETCQELREQIAQNEDAYVDWDAAYVDRVSALEREVEMLNQACSNLQLEIAQHLDVSRVQDEELRRELKVF